MPKPTTATAGDNSAPHVAYIDALRGWAFLAVLTVHLPHCVTVSTSVLRLLSVTNYGVQLFYVISALTLCMSFEARFARERQPLKAFFLRRFFRIAPLFWAATVFAMCYFGMGPRLEAPHGNSWSQIAATVLFVHGWHPYSINSVVPGGWSIAVEMNFYLLFPFCYRALASLRRSVVGTGVLLVGSVAVSIATRRVLGAYTNLDPSELDSFTYYWLPRQFAVFGLGFVLFWLLSAARVRWAAPNALPPVMRWLPYIVLSLIGLSSLLGQRLPLGYFTNSCLFAGLAFALAFRPIVGVVNPVVGYIGKVSFSAYLCHFFVVDIIANRLRPSETAWGQSAIGPLLCYLLSLAVVLGISSVTFRLVEEPCQSLGRRVIERLGYGREPAQS